MQTILLRKIRENQPASVFFKERGKGNKIHISMEIQRGDNPNARKKVE